MEILFFILLVLSVIFFALVGFACSVRWLFKGSKKTASLPGKRPTLHGDALAARRLIDHLQSNQQINAATYQRLKRFLAGEFPELFAESTPTRSQQEALPVEAKDVPPEVVIPASEPVGSALSPPSLDSQVHDAPAPEDSIVVAEAIVIGPDASDPVSSPGPNAPAFQAGSPTVQAGSTDGVSSVANSVQPAPWDLPDPPAPKPRRSFAELMSGFMQEKNMRWGELTSGILIVLSAVGLVVSLRDELRDTIPYFSSLLFLLITGAIHGAGIYTLKKWKLRNTSRGTLVIGLLLIPLNFVGACILSGGEQDRRALSDPWLWVAVSVGLAGFTAMTWWSSKCLFRRGIWPLVVAVIGCGVGTLLLNRLVPAAQSNLLYLLYALPVVGSFIVGTCLFDPRQWIRSRWTERATNRLFLFLGIATFAVIASLSIVVVRAESRLAGLIAMMPVASIVSVVGAWLGSVVRYGSEGETKLSLRFAGLTLEVLGVILLAASLLASISNPTIFVINAMVISIGLMGMLVHQRHEHWLPIAWAVFAAGILATLNLAWGNLPLDDWASGNQWASAVLNGGSGLCLLIVGMAVIGIHRVLRIRWTDANSAKRVALGGWIAGGGIFLAGCLIALIASFVNRENVFDVMTASGLISLAAIGSLVVCIVLKRNASRVLQYAPHVTSVLWIGGLSHALIWNPTIATKFDALTNDVGAGWVGVMAIHGLVMSLMAAWMVWPRTRTGGSKWIANSAARSFAAWGCVSSSIVWIGVLPLIGSQTGWGTIHVTLVCVNWFLISWSFSRCNVDEKPDGSASIFILSTAIVVVVMVAEVVSRFAWCPTFEVSDHWLIQLIAMSIWSLAWTVSAVALERGVKLGWLLKHSPRTDRVVLLGLAAMIGILVCQQIGQAATRELVSHLPPAGPHLFEGDTGWALGAIGTVGLALIAAMTVRPTAFMGAALVGVWMLTWAMGADFFDASRSAGSAVRWLLPIGGAVGAILVSLRGYWLPIWIVGRRQMGISGPSRLDGRSTQRLINLALSIVCLVVLLISSITVSRVLIHGGQALGGPAPGSWFRWLPPEVSFGAPIACVVATFLLYAISERRSWLATVGSGVFQYIVLLAIILLFLSPHPKLASTWFVGILQSVSLGMSVYGFVWYWQRNRIDRHDTGRQDIGATPGFLIGWPRQIEIHTLINGLLITSLAVLAMGRFFLVPNQPGDWISSVGSWLGIAAWALFGGLAGCIWWQDLVRIRSVSTWLWLAGWMGLILTGLLAAVVDQWIADPQDFVPWLPFRFVTMGAALVALLQTVLIWRFGHRAGEGIAANHDRSTSLAWPMLLSTSIGLTFAVRGAWTNPSAFWLYVTLIFSLMALVAIVGMTLRSGRLGFVPVCIGVIGVTTVWAKDPQNWFADMQPHWPNLVAIFAGVLALCWTAFYLRQRRVNHEPIKRRFLLMPNVVLLLGAGWMLLAAILQWPADSGALGISSTMINPLGICAFILITGLSITALWNDRSRFKVISWCCLSLALVIALFSVLSRTDAWRLVGVDLGAAFVVCGWGLVWIRRKRLIGYARRIGITRLAALETSTKKQLPTYSTLMTALIMWGALMVVCLVETRAHRYVATIVPFALAVGLGCQSSPSTRRWLQLLSLVLATVGGLFLAWADLNPEQLFSAPMLQPLVRSLIVLAGAMFVYGGLVTRWVRPGDTWLRSLREMAVVTCGLAMFCFALVIIAEQGSFQPGEGCGLAIGESIVVALLVLGMIAGLISIAVRPENDPFALSLQGRMGYVYAAELVVAALGAHLYFTMPWLFQFGIKEYWPYIAMAICFGGVGIARLLEQRNLGVLGQPLFHTAAILPVIVSAAVFGIESKADASMVMLVVGLVYLMISYTHRSALSGAASVIFGNFALWLFINRFPGFSFLEHPQLWLIPPAVSALIAGQLSRAVLTHHQLVTLRYVCVAMIYVSSTSEIFISGIGEKLWPPMVLASLAVIGIMAGIMLQVKSFLYFGALFLLMAMIAMVSHAHQRLDHVWPWWAFGIGLGLTILVMFGLFEKRKNDMKAIADGLREWDA